MSGDVPLILNLLLDRFERSKHYRATGASSRAVFIRYDQETLPDYWDEAQGQRRAELNAATALLAAQQVVRVRHSRYSREEIERVDLSLEALGRAYELAERMPLRSREEALAAVAEAWIRLWPEPEDWRRRFAESVRAAVAQFERLPAGLRPDEANLLEDLCRIADALGPSGLTAELPRRVFSQRVLGDSKRLEAMQGRLLRLLREFWPSPLPEAEHEALAELGIVENPQHVLVAGPVELDGLDVAITGAGLGLPAAFVDRCAVTGLAADQLITVENLTSFHQVVAALPPRTLVLYLGGYHNRSRRQLLLKLARAGVVRFFHWGDIDLGGFRIFVHLQKQTGLPLEALLMDLHTYDRHAAGGLPFAEPYARDLAALLTRPAFTPFWPVIREMLARRRRVEQESVDFV